MKSILFIIIDGLGDRPIKELNNQTPLEAANTPNLDALAAKSLCGLLNALPKGVYPTSEESHLAIFGYDYKKEYPGRGVLEALGIDIKLDKDDVAFRVDFGTVDKDLRVIDPRAGNIQSVGEFCNLLSGISIEEVRFDLYPAFAHRAVLVLRGEGISYLVSDTDPHKAGPHKIDAKVLDPVPLDDSKEAKFTARILKEYQSKTHKVLARFILNKQREERKLLPANFILTRGAGRLISVPNFYQKYGLSSVCIAGAPLYKGIARFLGMEVLNIEGATGGVDTDVWAKLKAAKESLSIHSFVFLHFKGADVVAEEMGDFEAKKLFIEKIDQGMTNISNLKDAIIVITGDHSTPCELRDHSEDPVPFLFYDGRKNNDKVKKFGESFCKEGNLGHIIGREVMKKVMNYF